MCKQTLKKLKYSYSVEILKKNSFEISLMEVRQLSYSNNKHK